MNRENITRLAQEAGFVGMDGDHGALRRFAALVASAERPWVGLTDEEVSEIIDREIGFNSCWGPEEAFARAVESKLREKNHG